MHVRDLVELAALVAVEAPRLMDRGTTVSFRVIDEYWAASKCRLDRWGRLLRKLRAAQGQPELPATLSWARVCPVLEEILATELLTRLWAAASRALDAACGEQELAPVAGNIFSAHLDARCRVLAILAEEQVISPREASHLNQLRRRVERWNDMLLAHLSPFVEIDEYAFEPARAHEFAEDLDRESAYTDARLTSQVVLASLRASFAEGLSERSPNADLNRRIAAAILTVVHEDFSGSADLVNPLWLQRLICTASEAEDMIEELVRLDRQSIVQ